ncbi:hypothetical protein ACIO87_10355 [Streptomyces sp. NPDC087218]|uniref:hypothetical protein n=1 Tax=Streptomyces sp. NPDC087218 TaxID=3365769 RepID=UPI003812442B
MTAWASSSPSRPAAPARRVLGGVQPQQVVEPEPAGGGELVEEALGGEGSRAGRRPPRR